MRGTALGTINPLGKNILQRTCHAEQFGRFVAKVAAAPLHLAEGRDGKSEYSAAAWEWSSEQEVSVDVRESPIMQHSPHTRAHGRFRGSMLRRWHRQVRRTLDHQ
jgi:hypothetical protein